MAYHGPHPDRPAVRAAVAFCEAFKRKEWDAMEAECGELHWGIAAGRFKGYFETPEAFVGVLKEMDELAGGTLELTDYEITSSERHLHIWPILEATRNGKTLEVRTGAYFLWGFSSEGEGLNGYGAWYFYDLPTWEEFWAD